MAKIRTGFVSNSSSSSFIVVGKKGNDKAKVTLEIDLKELSSSVANTLDELNSHIVFEYGYGDVDTVEEVLNEDWFSKDKYEQLVKEIEAGNTVYFGTVSTEDYGVSETYIANNGFGDLGPDFNVIQDAGDF